MATIGVDSMSKFIYVFSEEDRDRLISQGYALIKSDVRQGTYVFENKDTMIFDLHSVKFVYSDTITF